MSQGLVIEFPKYWEFIRVVSNQNDKPGHLFVYHTSVIVQPARTRAGTTIRHRLRSQSMDNEHSVSDAYLHNLLFGK